MRMLAVAMAIAGMLAPLPLRAEDAAERSIEELWTEATLWQVGSNAEKVPAARKALIDKGEPVLDFLIPDKLDTSSTLVTRGLNSVIRGLHRNEARIKFERTPVERLRVALGAENGNVRRNAAELLSLVDDKESAGAIAKLLEDPKAQRGALTALSRLGATETVPQIVSLLESDASERVRCSAVSALAKLKSEDSTSALVAALAHERSAIRFAAQFALEKQEALAALTDSLDAESRRARIHALMALGRLAKPETAGDLRPLLEHEDAALRGHAVKALAKVASESDWARLGLMQDWEKEVFVRTALREVLEGR